MTLDRRDEVARAWLIYRRHWWAFEALQELVHEAPEDAWAVVLRIVALADGDQMLGEVGAGPLEDFISENCRAMIDAIETEAASNERLRKALMSVWFSGEDAHITSRLLRLGCQQMEPKST